MVLSGLCRWANAPPAAVRAKFQGEFLDSSVDIGVDRLALLRSWVPGLIALNGVTSQPGIDVAMTWHWRSSRLQQRWCSSFQLQHAGDGAAAHSSSTRAAASSAAHVRSR